MRESTGKFDCNGLELFTRDKVIKSWAWFFYQGKEYAGYRIHIIIKNLVTGEFNLGTAMNTWNGPEVKFLSEEDFSHLTGFEDCLFFFLDGVPTKLTAKYWGNMTDEEYKEYLLIVDKIQAEMMWGKASN